MTSPTIVLVHGAFTDGSSWSPVAEQLLDRGYAVRVPPLSNRSLAADAASLSAFVEQIDGPVVLAGHAYGGAVVGVAGAARNVVGLVFVAAYVLEEGESLGQLQARFPASDLTGDLVSASYPRAGQDDGTDVSVRLEAYPRLLAEGIDIDVARVLAVSQRPLDASALAEPAAVASWRTRPGWGVLSSSDRAVHPEVQRFGYDRARLREVVELDAPHLVMLTRPTQVANVIQTAVEDTTTD